MFNTWLNFFENKFLLFVNCEQMSCKKSNCAQISGNPVHLYSSHVFIPQFGDNGQWRVYFLSTTSQKCIHIPVQYLYTDLTYSAVNQKIPISLFARTGLNERIISARVEGEYYRRYITYFFKNISPFPAH